MFDYSLVHWLTFLSAAFLLNLSPGQDMAYIFAHSAKGGQAGFAARFGLWSGTFLHVIFAALGLSAILLTSAAVYTLVKLLGAINLIWLGIQALRSQGGGGTGPQVDRCWPACLRFSGRVYSCLP